MNINRVVKLLFSFTSIIVFTSCDGELENTDIFSGGTINSTSSTGGSTVNSEEIDLETVETKRTILKTGQNSSYFGNDDGDRKDGLDRSYSDAGGYILDNTTKLYWQDSDSDYMSWEDAKRECSNLSTADFNNWRLPTRRELLNLVDRGEYNPAIDSVFTKIKLDRAYWTVTEVDSDSSSIWAIEFYNGEDSFQQKSELLYLICVREEEEE